MAPAEVGDVASPAKSAGMREERRVITDLFADLVGSTGLGERLDPEEAKLVVGEAIARIVRAVDELGGTVKDLAGDGVLALFGAPVAHEDDPERAVRAGLRIAREIEGYGAEVQDGWGVGGFAVRVGICTGTVVLGPVGGGTRVEYGATGDAVNTAARLQAAAQPGGVLVDGSTQRLIRSLFAWDGPRDLSLKGKSASVVAFEALRPLPVVAKVRGWEGPKTPLVGRDRELAVCGEAVRNVLAGAGGILFISGDAGIGKTRILAELRQTFESSASEGGQPVWLEGRCASYGQGQPFGPFRELLRDWLGLGPDQNELRLRLALRRRLEKLLGEGWEKVSTFLATILGLALQEGAIRLPELPPRILARRTFEAFEEFISKLSKEGPVVVALDDVQWADDTSIELSDHLLDLSDREPVLLVLAQRLDRDHGSWRIRERALRQLPHRTSEVVLGALPEEVDGELLSALVGKQTLPPPMHSRMLAAAGGNPFFLEELVRSLEDAGVLVREGQRWRFDHEAPVEIPPTIRRVILARMDKLSPTCHEALTAAAVLGPLFRPRFLEAVLGRPVDDTLRDLQRLDLIQEARRWPQPEYRFRHVLIQETAYRSLLQSRRQELHGRAARGIEALSPERLREDALVLAHHWREAGDPKRALAYFRLAGEAARGVFALPAAEERYTEALEMAATVPAPAAEVADLHLRRGRVRYESGGYAEARADFEAALGAARDAEEPPIELQALEGLGSLLFHWGGRPSDALLYLQDALRIARALGDEASQVSLLGRLCIVHANQLRLEEALRYGQQGVDLARRSPDEMVQARAMDSMKKVAGHVGDLATLQMLLPRLEEILRRHGELWYLQWTLFEASFVPMAEGRWGEAIRLAEDALATCRRIGDRASEPYFLGGVAWVRRATGEYGEALRVGREAVALALDVKHPWWTAWTEAMLGWTLLDVHDIPDAIGHLESGLREAERAGGRDYLLRCAGHLARALWLAGDPASALATADRAERLLAEVTTPVGRVFLHGGHAVLALAEVRLGNGQAERSAAMVEPFVAAAEASGWCEVVAHGSLVLGLCRSACGDEREAEELVRRALDVASGRGLPGLALRAHAALAVLLSASGHSEQAGHHTADATRIADRLAASIGDENVRRGFLESVKRELDESIL